MNEMNNPEGKGMHPIGQGSEAGEQQISNGQRRRLWRKISLAACLVAMTAPAFAQKLKVVELFTSHGCSSCPKADELLGEMSASDPDLLLLEYHVDYWNSLVHGGDGNFVDPFSSSAFTDRQRQYRQVSMRGRPGVYTPQAIINGRTAAVGSYRSAIVEALESSPDSPLSVSIEAGSDDLSIKVQGDEAAMNAAADSTIMMVRFHRQRTTEITGGENRHLSLVNHNVVHEMNVLGRVSPGAPMSFEVSANAEGDGCAILVQSPALDILHAAVGCP